MPETAGTLGLGVSTSSLISSPLAHSETGISGYEIFAFNSPLLSHIPKDWTCGFWGNHLFQFALASQISPASCYSCASGLLGKKVSWCPCSMQLRFCYISSRTAAGYLLSALKVARLLGSSALIESAEFCTEH